MTDQKAEKPMTQLHPNRIVPAEFAFTTYRVVPEHETPFEALLDPAYWAHVSARFKPWDQIVVQAEDESYYGRLLVRDAGKLYAKVTPLEYHALDDVPVQQGSPAVAEGYAVKWRGPLLRWCVVRGKDPLKEGMDKSAANLWLSEHLKTVGT